MEQLYQRRQRLKCIALSMMAVGKGISKAKGIFRGHDDDLAHQLVGFPQRNCQKAGRIDSKHIVLPPLDQSRNPLNILSLSPLILGTDGVIAIIVNNIPVLGRNIAKLQPVRLQKDHDTSLFPICYIQYTPPPPPCQRFSLEPKPPLHFLSTVP